jgi:hypothetical protein
MESHSAGQVTVAPEVTVETLPGTWVKMFH